MLDELINDYQSHNVSFSKLPKWYEFMKKAEKEMDKEIDYEETKKLLSDGIGADCWAVIVQYNNNLCILQNTYCLFKKMGHSFNVGYIYNEQYEREDKCRQKLIDEPQVILDNIPLGSIIYILFGEDLFVIEKYEKLSNDQYHYVAYNDIAMY